MAPKCRVARQFRLGMHRRRGDTRLREVIRHKFGMGTRDTERQGAALAQLPPLRERMFGAGGVQPGLGALTNDGTFAE